VDAPVKKLVTHHTPSTNRFDMRNLDVTVNDEVKTHQLILDSQPSSDKLPALGDSFVKRHIGPSTEEVQQMLDVLGIATLDDLINQTVPQAIRLTQPLQLPA
jgi:glycine dehydrogenase